MVLVQQLPAACESDRHIAVLSERRTGFVFSTSSLTPSAYAAKQEQVHRSSMLGMAEAYARCYG
ncbi:MAG: hypothetical protein V4682_01355 [Patescibacteria group bacterium]